VEKNNVAHLVSLDGLIYRLRLDRRRCFIVTGRPGEGKTRLAEQMAARYDGKRLDMLSLFAENPDLTAGVDTFTPESCKALLQSYANGDLVLIDEIEFLWHRWDDGEKRAFLNILKLWSKPAFFGIFLPPHPVIESFEMLDQDRRPRIFSLHDLQGIG
jgi:chromosomal replication initiation ATPase DnaA